MNTPKPWSLGRCILNGVLGLIIVVVFVHTCATFVLGRMVESRIKAIKAQGDPVSMSDLAGPPIPDSENGGAIYQAVLDKLKKHRWAERLEWQKSHGALTRDQYPYDMLASAAISPNRETRAKFGIWDAAIVYTSSINELLPQLELADTKPKCRYTANWQDRTREFEDLRGLARTLSVKSVLDARNVDMDGAVRTLTTAYKVGNTIKDEPSLMSVLARSAVRHMESSALQRVAEYGHVDKADARTLYDLYSHNDIREHSILAMKGERACFIGVFQTIPKDGETCLSVDVNHGDATLFSAKSFFHNLFYARILGSYAWRPFLYADELQTLRIMDKAIDIQRESYRESAISGVWNRLNSEIDSMPSYVQVTRILFPVYSRMSAKRDECVARTCGDQIFLALLAYKDSFGMYPVSLDEARAKLGWKLQEDPFSEKDFVYMRDGNGFVLYSIGMNLKDDKGLGMEDRKPSHNADYDDITWRMEH